jgi:hypothetical protein
MSKRQKTLEQVSSPNIFSLKAKFGLSGTKFTICEEDVLFYFLGVSIVYLKERNASLLLAGAILLMAMVSRPTP